MYDIVSIDGDRVMQEQSTSPVPARSARTKLTPEREQELYEAVLELLRERGYDALTMDAVASRTRSSKATLYRQWHSKLQLVMSALRQSKGISLGDIDTGTLEGDLREMSRQVSESAGEDTALLHALSHAGFRDPELMRALREVLFDPEIRILKAALARAVDRGELDAGNPASDYLVPVFLGALMSRPLIEGRHADTEYLDRFIDAVIRPALRLP
ncbi:TetR/AcrR family transcriptional regulator [Streptomyces sodiiphilus]|uniref:TetR/AcrR family transcriptional regulator n=1 Tax=Streptomyces sodiiphilus TaxID=226217 RepID=A0ABN2PVT6_9ACTN